MTTEHVNNLDFETRCLVVQAVLKGFELWVGLDPTSQTLGLEVSTIMPGHSFVFKELFTLFV